MTNKTSWFRCSGPCGFLYLYKDAENIPGIGNCCTNCASDLRTEIEEDRKWEFIIGELD